MGLHVGRCSGGRKFDPPCTDCDELAIRYGQSGVKMGFQDYNPQKHNRSTADDGIA